jgi:hypothetical protein
MKFGDLVKNEWAGDINPNRILMIVHHGKMVKCLNKKGHIVNFHNDKDLRLTKVGKVNFNDWFIL